MSKTKSQQLLALVVFASFAVFASPGAGQFLDCTTAPASPDSLHQKGLAPPYVSNLTRADVRVYLHIIRDGDGTGGLTQSQIDSLFWRAKTDFAAENIFLNLESQTEIDDSDFYSDPAAYSSEIFATDSHSDGIDIYLGPSSGTVKSGAVGIPGTAMFLTGAYDSDHSLSHSLGHCLGLYDTHETIFGASGAGTNSAADGDLIGDTNADPGLSGKVDSLCAVDSSILGGGYDPDPTNIMSGSRTSCWVGFTEEQAERILATLDSSSELELVLLENVGPYQEFSDDTSLRDYGNPQVGQPSIFPLDPSNAVSFDYDGDGDKDIVVSGHYNVLSTENRAFVGATAGYSNEGVPEFNNDTSSAFVGGERVENGTTGLIAADFDNDSNIDFYAPNPNYESSGGKHRLYRNTGAGQFENVTSDVGLYPLTEGGQYNDESISGAWGDYDGDGFLDLVVITAWSGQTPEGAHAARTVRLYRSIENAGGDGREFVDVTSSTGLSTSIEDVHSALWVDFDQDLDVDLVLVQVVDNDEYCHSKYYFNNGDGSFSDSTSTHLLDIEDWKKPNGFASVGDFDNDADLDIVYHTPIRRAWYKNDFNGGVGTGKISRAWLEDQPVNSNWYIETSDVDVFDSNLDGHLDFSMANRYDVNDSPHIIYEKSALNSSFSPGYITSLESDYSFGRAMCTTDFNLDGYTELYVAASLERTFFFKSMDSYQAPTSDWVGIRLASTDSSCNFRGLGATVTVTQNTWNQAQLVDGGSGRAGQNDLDLSFGLPASSDSVRVDIGWPCGQDQRIIVPTGAYNTIELELPEVDADSTKFEVTLYPGYSHQTWTFTWYTDNPSDNSLDKVKFLIPVPVSGGQVTEITPSTNNVIPNVKWIQESGNINGRYEHTLAWNNVPCLAPFTVKFQAQSAVNGHVAKTDVETRRIKYCLTVP